jgi:hypothetical protein
MPTQATQHHDHHRPLTRRRSTHQHTNTPKHSTRNKRPTEHKEPHGWNTQTTPPLHTAADIPRGAPTMGLQQVSHHLPDLRPNKRASTQPEGATDHTGNADNKGWHQRRHTHSCLCHSTQTWSAIPSLHNKAGGGGHVPAHSNTDKH